MNAEPDFAKIVGEHRAAHPYFLDGVAQERARIIALLQLTDATFADSAGFAGIRIPDLIKWIEGKK